MQCEICNKKDAVVHFKHVADGEVRELNICEDCASENGISIQPPDLLTDFLMGKAQQSALKKPAAGEPTRRCLTCGMKDSDFDKMSRLGCSDCYEAFEKDVEEVAVAMQKGDRHVGKIPEGRGTAEDQTLLTGMLNDAVKVENFEEAARIRDIIGGVREDA